MYDIFATSRFKKDLKLAIKRKYYIPLMDVVITLLEEGKPLPDKNDDHPLKGNYEGCRECHITPDWLLIYEIDEDEGVLYLTRTGTHSDLF